MPTLTQRLGLESLIDATVRLVGRVGGARPGRKVLTLVHAMIAGATHIDHADILRAGSTAAVLPHRVMAPSTLGTFLRVFTFGHVRQSEAVIGRALQRAWAAGAGPGAGGLVIDIDSTICPVDGKQKQGAGFGYTKVLGYHPILATRADSGVVLHARMRKGAANTQRGARRFIDELVARVRRAGTTGELTVRVDSGLWSNDTITTLNRLDVRYTMAVRCNTNGVTAAIATIADDAWVDIDYPDGGQAQVAECAYTTGTGRRRVTRRLIVRRTRLTDTALCGTRSRQGACAAVGRSGSGRVLRFGGARRARLGASDHARCRVWTRAVKAGPKAARRGSLDGPVNRREHNEFGARLRAPMCWLHS